MWRYNGYSRIFQWFKFLQIIVYVSEIPVIFPHVLPNAYFERIYTAIYTANRISPVDPEGPAGLYLIVSLSHRGNI